MTLGPDDRSNSGDGHQLASQGGFYDSGHRAQPTRPTSFSRRFGIRAGKSSLGMYFGVLPTWRASQPGHRIGQTPVAPSTRSAFASRPRIPGFLKAYVKTLVSVAFLESADDPSSAASVFPWCRLRWTPRGPYPCHYRSDDGMDRPATVRRDSVRSDGAVSVAGSPGYFSNVAFDGGS